jgi:hypothetical protein
MLAASDPRTPKKIKFVNKKSKKIKGGNLDFTLLVIGAC